MNNFINNYDLFIFDLNNTLLETEKYHYKAWKSILKKKIGPKYKISEDFFFQKFDSIKKDSFKKYLKDELNLKNYNELLDEKNIIYIKLLNKNRSNLKFMNGADQFLKLVIKNNKKFVIVSNSIKKNIDILIEFFPILSYSSKIYCSEMFKKKKPHPECYLKVVKDFPNFKMVGFEDSLTGIEALTKVKCIKPIFINTSKYYYYDHIINNYMGLINIKNFFELN